MDDIIRFLEEKKPFIDSKIREHFPEKMDSGYLEEILGKTRHEYDLDSINKSITEPVWDILKRGGKRWRPTLFLLIAKAMGADLEKIQDFAIIPEIIHNGTLMADDVEDGSDLRRGKPCIHKIYGVDVAVNTSSFMFYMPLAILIKNRDTIDPKTLLWVYEIYVKEMINLSIGQGLDIWWHKGKADGITEKQYLQMCSCKTGTLARMAAKLAVALSGGTEEQEEKIGRFAESIGIAFQIQDDILSASGGKFQEKKGYGDDITEGKRTLMVIYSLKKASEGDKKRLLQILDMHTRDKELIKEAIDILHKYGSIDYASGVARDIVSDAWKDIDPILPESDAKKKLKTFADFLIERDI
ncbi:MAG: polyprenyl synthetase family protein [Candidatus Aenigmatarchaeota archaeon]|nr:MAG: polyprenyl synthetase family protein [Candidatus Aenigmarchaeota archaeon]